MSSRSFCELNSWELCNPSTKDRALRELMEGHIRQFSLEETQVSAWSKEIEALAEIASQHPNSTFALEYMIPRMGKRVDAIALIDNCIFVIEFKVGERNYPRGDIDQVIDYSFDLKNFHRESHNRNIYPILCCTKAKACDNKITETADGVFDVQLANAVTLKDAINNTLAFDRSLTLNHRAWLDSQYSPTPTIVEAAQALYESNEVEDISRNEAGLTNIKVTTSCVENIVTRSKANHRKSICFITGVPGAGKTLVGLNLASKRRSEGDEPSDETAVFLSGNGPLIEVLQASLVKDQQERDKRACERCCKTRSKKECAGCLHYRTKGTIEAEVKTFVQGVHLFREELFLSDAPPHEHVTIFDESQRAWSRDHLSRKMRTRRANKREVNMSEPECLIEYMDRHKDWSVMVCLVGGGQEINQGEAGIIEWFNALAGRFEDWDIYAASAITADHYLTADDISSVANRINYIDDLHLSVDMRSFRNKRVSEFAEALVENNPDKARTLYPQIAETYPIVLTRDLTKAKDWVREQTKRPSDRYGIIADSFGQRIRADGITVPVEFDAPTWFLEGKDNIDSSYFMEVAASEFKIQGLEIDYAVIAWEGDYRYDSGEFEYHRFHGKKWQNVNSDMLRRYLKNGYRVLLTRARQGYVIYVPRGSEYDPTRPPSYYNGTYEYLRDIGIREI